jgi:Pectate lyase superfamily protein
MTALSSFSLPSAERQVYGGDPPADVNAILNCLFSMGGLGNPLNYGADPTGSTDSTAAFTSALAAFEVIFVPAGNYLLDSSALAYTGNGQRITGAGQGATTLTAGSSFSGSELISCAGYNDCGLSDLSIVSATGAWSTAPAVPAVLVAHAQRFRMRDVRGYALGGYLVQVVSDATGDSYYPVLDHVTASFCASGAHFQGSASSDHLMGAFISNCTFEECENGDGLFIEDCYDVTCVNLEASPAGAPTGGGVPGYCLHVKGTGANQFYTNLNMGAEVSGAASSNAVILVEANSGGSFVNNVVFAQGVAQFGSSGVEITAGTEITLTGMQLTSNGQYGYSDSGSTTERILITGCTFGGNNTGANTTAYDLYHAGTGILYAHGNLFTTPSGSGAGELPSSAVGFHSGAGQSNFKANWFNGQHAFESAGGFPGIAHINTEFNPSGPEGAPGIPSSGSALTNPYGEDCMVYITAASGGTCGVAIIGSSVCTLPASGICGFLVPESASITLTYGVGNAPSWAWIAN